MKKKNYFLIGLLGFLLVIIATAITYFIALTASGAITRLLVGDAPVCSIHTFAFPGMLLVIFVIYEVILFTRQAVSAKAESPSSSSDDKSKYKNAFIIVVIVCLISIILCTLSNAFFRTELHEDSIVKVSLLSKKAYHENNVAEYRLNCDENGVDFTVVMRDGSTFELFNNTKTITDSFIEKYENIYGYGAALAEDLNHPDGDYTIKRTIVGEKYIIKDQSAADYDTKWKYINTIAQGAMQ